MAAVKPRAAISWSGGKDSCAALARVRDSFDVVAMITMFDEPAARSRSHGLRPEVLTAQAARLRLDRITETCSWQTYDEAFSRAVDAAASRGVTHIIFGDIMFEEHRRWAERMCEPCGITAVEPLWGLATDVLFDEWVESGSEALIVTARAAFLDAAWLGRPLAKSCLAEFRRLGVDPCGERGEYHTVVTSTRLFTEPLRLRRGAAVQHSGCWALDLEVADAEPV